MDKQEVESIDDRINELADEIEDRQKSSNGFLTKKGKLFNTAEWHSIAISVSWASLPFALPTPLDAMFIVTYALFMKKLINGEAFNGTQLGDPGKEFAYSLPPYAVTTWFFVTQTGYTVESIEVGRMLIAMFAGV